MNAADIVAYTYVTENLCPTCVVEAMIARGIASPGARGMRTEDVLHQVAEYVGVDYDDEQSYDTEEFPKIVLASQVEDGECCGSCQELII